MPQALQEPQVHKACLVLRVLRGLPVRSDQWAPKDLRVYKVIREPRAQLVRRVHRAYLDRLAPRERKA